ncbi:MAG: virulence RhuM family protein [Candidatus Delongbacteria bacterium]|nr:virulence RhuM family protein [Candidatus Delongbacteria bacterium]
MSGNRNLILYCDGELELKVSFSNETVWLRQDEISELFEKDRTVITRHINNILKDKEVDKVTNVQKMHFANSDKPVKLYSLDIILAVGYRTNSAKAIRFRKWSTNILKNYILNGYAINTDQITHQRFIHLENDVKILQEKVGAISKDLDIKEPLLKQGILFDKQVFDAYKYVCDIVKSAENGSRGCRNVEQAG